MTGKNNDYDDEAYTSRNSLYWNCHNQQLKLPQWLVSIEGNLYDDITSLYIVLRKKDFSL